MGRDAFFVSPANAQALAQIDAWRSWPQGRLVLTGPAGAGKTHLAGVWAAQAGAGTIEAAALPEADLGALAEAGPLVVEGADRLAGGAVGEAALLHLLNLMAPRPLLLTAAEAPARWGVELPDLRSRLEATTVATLGAPDDALLGAVLLKLFSDRQIAPPPALIAFLVARIDRSFRAAAAIVAAIDAECLRTMHPATIPLASRLLDKLHASSP